MREGQVGQQARYCKHNTPARRAWKQAWTQTGVKRAGRQAAWVRQARRGTPPPAPFGRHRHLLYTACCARCAPSSSGSAAPLKVVVVSVQMRPPGRLRASSTTTCGTWMPAVLFWCRRTRAVGKWGAWLHAPEARGTHPHAFAGEVVHGACTRHARACGVCGAGTGWWC